jgi:hypothetical protein
MRDWTVATVTALAMVTVGLRVLLAAVGIGPWTVAWRVVELPTQPFISVLELGDILDRTLVGHLTIAEVIFATVTGIAALTILSSTALRRPD